MNRNVIVIAATLICSVAMAQSWRAVGRGVIGPNEVQTLFGDSVSDRLLAGGTFLHILNESDTVLGYGQAAWNGTRWDSLATRIQPDGGGEGAQQIFWFLRFQGALYACGGYLFLDETDSVNSSFARLNGTTLRWEALECINPAPESGLLTLVPKVPQGTLYTTGYKGSVCGFPESCVFRYDGSAFHVWEPFGQIPYDSDNYVGTIFDFHGKTYMTCSVPDPTGPGYVSFLRFNGSTWEHVPGWNTLSPIKEISVHDDILYVSGCFHENDGGPGNLVAAFDGEQWNDLGGGLTYPPAPMSACALDMEWLHDELWVCGLFDHAAGVPAHSIAKWNGHQWCMPPGDIQWHFGSLSTLTDMAVWRDSLYVCGGIYTIDGEPFGQVAQWIGGDAVEGCSADVGIAEAALTSFSVTLAPNPATTLVSVHDLPSTAKELMVLDVFGRTVLRASARTRDIDVHELSQGTYVLHVVDASGAPLATARFVKR